MQSTYNYIRVTPAPKKRYKININILTQRILALILIIIQIATIKLLQDATICVFLIPLTILLLVSKENLLDL